MFITVLTKSYHVTLIEPIQPSPQLPYYISFQ